MYQIETYAAFDVAEFKPDLADAIVILASDWESGASEYGSDTVGYRTLVRLRYGAYLQRKTGLPIVVSGGDRSGRADRSLAQMMAQLLQEEFQAGEVWQEGRSRTTKENAMFSKALLEQKGMHKILLVTHASHMRRAVAAFENAGLRVVPAPTRFMGADILFKPLKLTSILPSAGAFHTSRQAVHEMVGIIWYEVTD